MRTFAQKQKPTQQSESANATTLERQPGQIEGHLRTKRTQAGSTGDNVASPLVHEILRSPGQPLSPVTREFMDSRFGHDFSQVRIHTDARAAESARAVDALAYTVGRNIVFGEGQYAPQTLTGKRLLAHELTHTLQQSSSPGLQTRLVIGGTDDPAEREAETQAARVAEGHMPTAVPGQQPGPHVTTGEPSSNMVAATPGTVHRVVIGSSGGVRLQRQPPPEAAPAKADASQLYQQALGKLQKLDPKLYSYLSKAPLGGGPTEILRDVSQGQPGVPTLTVVVNLNVSLASLPQNKDAEFSPGTITRPAAPGAPYVFEFNMAINQSMPATTIPEMLAEILVHEGTHLQIAMDKVVFNPASKSSHEVTFAKYQTTAKALASYENLLIFLNNYMEMVLKKHNKPTDEAARQKDAQKIMDLLLEEKYVYDQDKAKFGASRTNAQLAVDYIKDGLNAVGILPAANLPNLQSILIDVEEFLDELDSKLKPASTPATPPPPPAATP